MSIMSGLKRQLRSVIEWQDDGTQLFQQWTENGDEIKNASQLIVGPGQGCIFVYEGRVRAMLHKEGKYKLDTDNIPFITTLLKVMQFFESDHKVGIYFFRVADVVDQKWGTTSPVKYQDPLYDFPVGLKAYGNYSYRLRNPAHFFTNILGARESFAIEQMRQVVTDRLLHSLSDHLAESRLSFAEVDAQRVELANDILQKVDADLDRIGIHLNDLRIEGTDFDDETNARIARIADVAADSYAANKAGMSYADLQRVQALRDAAKNESGAAGAGVGIGAGIGLGQQMAEQMQPNAGQNDVVASLMKLKQLFEAEVITPEEYAQKKQELMAKL